MGKILRLTEGEFHKLIMRIVENSFEDETKHSYEDEPDIVDDERIFDDDYGLEKYEDDFQYEPEDFDKEMKLKSFMKTNKPSSVGIGSGRWEKQEPYNPIKPSDVPLEKYLKMKKLKKG